MSEKSSESENNDFSNEAGKKEHVLFYIQSNQSNKISN